jgi:SNF2 family DNA or RNA helicase
MPLMTSIFASKCYFINSGEHRVLIFSQFVEMLQVLVPMLAEEGIKFCYLDGSTKNRGEVVRQFQENEDIPVFLISLKAGGVGLNLTGADTVILWTPGGTQQWKPRPPTAPTASGRPES